MKLDAGQGHLAYHLDGFYRHRDDLQIGGRAIDTAKVAIKSPRSKYTQCHFLLAQFCAGSGACRGDRHQAQLLKSSRFNHRRW